MIPEIRIHPLTGKILRRDIRPIGYTYKGELRILNKRVR